MEKLTVTAHMKTPFITGGGYMTFDALLAGILFDQMQDVEAAHASVPIKCTDCTSSDLMEPFDPISKRHFSAGDLSSLTC